MWRHAKTDYKPHQQTYSPVQKWDYARQETIFHAGITSKSVIGLAFFQQSKSGHRSHFDMYKWSHMCLKVMQVLKCDQSALPCCFPSIHCLAWSAGRRHAKDILHVLLEQHHRGPIPRIKWTRSPCQETLSRTCRQLVGWVNFHGNGRAGDGQHKATEGTLHIITCGIRRALRYCDGVFIRLVCTLILTNFWKGK